MGMKSNELKIIEDIQEAIVMAGGRFFRSQEIKNLALGDLIHIAIHNGIEIDIKYTAIRDPS
jgi:hypothetical protein